MIGQHSKKLPKEEKANRKFRVTMARRTLRSKAAQQEELGKCREDILYWVNAYVWQYNPDMMGFETGPFLTFPFQDELIATIQASIFKGKDLVIEKSRKMGLTWINLFIMDHYYLFDTWKQFLMFSRNAEAVDASGPNSLFWKIDFLHRHLPKWMKPTEERTKMHYKNTVTECVIDGETTTERAGVGGRALAIFIDEAAHIPKMWEIWHRTAATAQCRILNSTHTSSVNCFADLVRKHDGTIDHARVHWSEHPWYRRGLYQYSKESNRVEVLDKTFEYDPGFKFVCDGRLRSPWYDYERERIGDPRACAMEYDIDPQGSMSQFFDAVKIRNLQAMCCQPWWTGNVSHDATGHKGILEEDKAGLVELWCHLPEGTPAKSNYVIGADISQGTGNSNSCLSIVNGATGEKVGQYVNAHIDPKELAVMAAALGRIFQSETGQSARFIWENAGPGLSFGLMLLELGYTNVYYRRDEQTPWARPDNERPGFSPTPAAQLLLLQEYRAALANGRFLNRSREALEECLDFRYTSNGQVEHAKQRGGNDPSGARINHGDRVVADALAWKEAKRLQEPVIRKEKEQIPYGSLLWRRKLREEQDRESEFEEVGL